MKLNQAQTSMNAQPAPSIHINKVRAQVRADKIAFVVK